MEPLSSTLAFGIPGGYELVLIVLVLLLLFGAGRIPELARYIGAGLNECKEGIRESREALLDNEASDREQLPESTEEPDVNDSA